MFEIPLLSCHFLVKEANKCHMICQVRRHHSLTFFFKGLLLFSLNLSLVNPIEFSLRIILFFPSFLVVVNCHLHELCIPGRDSVNKKMGKKCFYQNNCPFFCLKKDIQTNEQENLTFQYLRGDKCNQKHIFIRRNSVVNTCVTGLI